MNSRNKISAHSLTALFLIDEEMPINEWLTGYLLSFADGLEVIEPATLRTALKEKIHSMQKKYDKQVSGS